MELVNGNGGTVYQTITLPDVDLAAGDYFVVCANAATVENCDLDVMFTPDSIGDKTAEEIAYELGISHQTVKNHMTAILRKLGVDDRTQAAVYALSRGWVRLEKPLRE